MFARHFFITFFLSMAALLSACQSPGNGYLMNGIGAELPARDIESATQLQRKYFDHLCVQAGLGGDGCALDLNDRVGWNLVVQQGMNDIDRRCDAYLEWLDNQRRNRRPLLSQVDAVQNTTAAIIGFVAPGSTKAINVVLAAFGLVTKSIENYHSRLLLEIESSTINSVVLRARNDFRQAYSGKSVANKPEAEYVLREYLRRCLPFAIETQINDLSTLGSRGIRASEENSIFEQPVAFQRPAFVSEPRQPLTPKQKFGTKPGRPDFVMDQRLAKVFTGSGYVEGNLLKLQRVLCVDESGLNEIGPQTLAGIVIFEQTPWLFGARVNDGRLSETEWQPLSNFKDCDKPKFRNFFERERLKSAASMRGLTATLNLWLPDNPLPSGAGLGEAAVRAKIAEARILFRLADFGGTAGDQVTPDLLDRLQTPPPEPEPQP